MQRLVILSILVALAASAPASDDTVITTETVTTTEKADDIVYIKEELFDDYFKIYTTEHEIVSLHIPLNDINFDENDETDDDKKILFYVEADIVDGKKEFKGLSRYWNRTSTKVLETGTCAAGDAHDNSIVYFGATDGIYKYNDTDKKIEKYGTITDSIINIAKGNTNDNLYILTDKNELFKVTKEGTKEKIDAHDVQEFVTDFAGDNIYYYCSEKKFHVITATGNTEFTGLPTDSSYVKIARAPFIVDEGAVVILDNKSYFLFANGSYEDTEIVVQAKPSAYAMDAALLQYFAYNKSIYEYNVLLMLLMEEDTSKDLFDFLNENKNLIEDIATRSVSLDTGSTEKPNAAAA